MKQPNLYFVLSYIFLALVGCGRVHKATDLSGSVEKGHDAFRTASPLNVFSVEAYRPYPTYLKSLVSESGQLDLDIQGNLNPSEVSQDLDPKDLNILCDENQIEFQNPTTGARQVRVQPGQLRVIVRVPAKPFVDRTCSLLTSVGKRISFRIADLADVLPVLEAPTQPPPIESPQPPIATLPVPPPAEREVCEQGFEWGEGRCVLAKQYITTLPGGLTCQPRYLRSYVICGTIEGNVGNRQCVLEDVKGVPTYYWTDCK